VRSAALSLNANTSAPSRNRSRSSALPGLATSGRGRRNHSAPSSESPCQVKPLPDPLRISARIDPSRRCTSAGCRLLNGSVRSGPPVGSQVSPRSALTKNCDAYTASTYAGSSHRPSPSTSGRLRTSVQTAGSARRSPDQDRPTSSLRRERTTDSQNVEPNIAARSRCSRDRSSTQSTGLASGRSGKSARVSAADQSYAIRSAGAAGGAARENRMRVSGPSSRDPATHATIRPPSGSTASEAAWL